MNWLEKWFLRRLCRKLVLQGLGHKQNITQYYLVMRDAAQWEFSEDNKPSLDGFLEECHKEAGKSWRNYPHVYARRYYGQIE